MKISYLRQYIEKEIILDIYHKKFRKENELLDKILEYVYECLHPKLFTQFDVWWSKIRVDRRRVTNFAY